MDHAPETQTVRLIVRYDGTGLSGWQRQRGVPTVQELRSIDGFKRRQARAYQAEWLAALDRVANLPTSELPPVDLIIRTSGKLRTNNFLLWASSHAQFYTTPALWTEFTRAELLTALRSVSANRAAGPDSVPGSDSSEPSDNGE